MLKKFFFRVGTPGMTARWVAKQYHEMIRQNPSATIPEVFAAIVMLRYLADPQNPQRLKILEFAGENSVTRLVLGILWHESTLASVDRFSRLIVQHVVNDELLKKGVPESLVTTEFLH